MFLLKAERKKVLEITGGVNQSGIRDHNERLILSMLQRHGPMPSIDVARQSGLSSQTVSIIMRKLEKDGFISRGEPVRGKVGKPSTPMKLNPNGLFSVGLKIGRRSSNLVLLDFCGHVRQQLHTSYQSAVPETVFGFLESGLQAFLEKMTESQRARLCGIGVGIPFELWKLNESADIPNPEFETWFSLDLKKIISQFTDLPIYIANDATAACHAEHLFGRGKDFRDYAYFFIGSFIGGGVVLNGTVFEGNQGNAGSMGSMRTTSPLGESKQLIDTASLHLLETRLIDAGIDPSILWKKPQNWSSINRYVEPWIGETAQELAKASLSICSVIDFEAILIDGALPTEVRQKLTTRVRRYIANQDKRGLITPTIEAGVVGENARAMGAASNPIFQQFLLNTNAGLSVKFIPE